MAKLLIIDDQIEMVRLIQTYMQTINPRFTEENTFCFVTRKGAPCLSPLNQAENAGDRALFLGKKDAVFSAVFNFLNEHSEEQILIMIDVLLNTLNISAPSYERYRADEEYSCELYAELLRVKNGKELEHLSAIQPDQFFHIIYSRSDASIGVVMTVLRELYAMQGSSDKKFFPEDCTLFENISWCRNRCESTDENFFVNPTSAEKEQPIALPKGYQKFFKTLQ